MKKIKYLFIIIFLICTSILLSACDLLNGTKTTDSTFTLTYETDGNGYIVCEYESKASIKKDTRVSLQAVANDGYNFLQWMDAYTGEVLSISDTITVKIDKDVNIYAAFKESTTIITPPEDTYYILRYEVNGSGSISCSYQNGSSIKEDTIVSLSATADEGNVFIEWINGDNGEVYSQSANIDVTVSKSIFLIAAFEEDTVVTPPVVDTHTKIKDLVVGKDALIKASVVVTFKKGFVIKDDTGYALCYLGSPLSYTCGDIIEFNATPSTYKGNIQITELKNCKKVGYELINDKPTSFTEEDINTYLASPIFGKYILIEASIVKVGDYYDIKIGDSINYLYPYNYDESLFNLSVYTGNKLKIYGYLWGNATENNPYIILESIEEIEVIDLSDTIIAYFNDDWTNPYITLDNGSRYQMTSVGDHYEYKLTQDVDNLYFSSGNYSTEVLKFDEDSYTFVLGNARYNGKYDGYFTENANKSNDVIKITTLEINDLHGYIEQENGRKGISNASYLINQIRNEDNLDNVVLVANGDIFQGTAISNLTRGRSLVEIMNVMNFDFMGIGNHEFDWGIEEIFKYFDGNSTNGEANFPLVNSNVYYKSTNKVVTFAGSNIVESLMIEKEGVKIGVVSCIGMLKSSILATRTTDYNFEAIVKTATPLCQALRDKGADIVLVNIHDGDSSGVNDYTINSSLASLKYKGKNLVDLVINGHTHTNQYGYIERSDADMPITQAGCNCQYLGELCIYFDKTLGEVVYSRGITYDIRSTVGNNYDAAVQSVVDEKYNEVKDQIEVAYCKAGANVSQKSQLYDWAAQVMLTSVGADCAVSNTGGIRSTGSITKGEDIRLGNMFEIIPFDNEIIICDVRGSTLKSYLQSTSNYYGLKSGLSLSSINSTTTYKVAVIDYVYYGNYFTTNTNPINTHVVYRDALIEDLKLRTTFNVYNDKTAVVGLLYHN